MKIRDVTGRWWDLTEPAPAEISDDSFRRRQKEKYLSGEASYQVSFLGKRSLSIDKMLFHLISSGPHMQY